MRVICMIAVLISTFFFVSCTSKDSRGEEISVDSFLGRYVSESYSRRSEGYDWISVLITKRGDHTVDIAIRSRSDIKKPTCTFDGEGVIADRSTIKSIFEGRNILFNIENGLLKIEMEEEADRDLLHYFCSGGATLEGTYKRID